MGRARQGTIRPSVINGKRRQDAGGPDPASPYTRRMPASDPFAFIPSPQQSSRWEDYLAAQNPPESTIEHVRTLCENARSGDFTLPLLMFSDEHDRAATAPLMGELAGALATGALDYVDRDPDLGLRSELSDFLDEVGVMGRNTYDIVHIPDEALHSVRVLHLVARHDHPPLVADGWVTLSGETECGQPLAGMRGSVRGFWATGKSVGGDLFHPRCSTCEEAAANHPECMETYPPRVFEAASMKAVNDVAHSRLQEELITGGALPPDGKALIERAAESQFGAVLDYAADLLAADPEGLRRERYEDDQVVESDGPLPRDADFWRTALRSAWEQNDRLTVREALSDAVLAHTRS